MFHKTGVIKVMIPNPGAVSPASGNRLYNLSTDAINLNVGAIGAYSLVADSGNPVAVNPAVTPPAVLPMPFRFVLRRDIRQDRSPLTPREFEESPWFDGNCMYGVKLSATAVRTPANHLMLVGSTTPAVAIPTDPEVNYRIQVSVRGDRSDLINSIYNTPTFFGDFLAPDFAVGVTANQRRDIITSGLAQSFNANSQGRVLAMVITTNNALGASNGPTIATVLALPVGSRVTVGYDPQGRPVVLVLDKAILRSLAALPTALGVTAADLAIRIYNPAGTPNVPVGVQVAGGFAGGTVAGDHIAFLSIDDFTSYYDYKMNLKSRITVGLTNGLGTAAVREIQTPDEGAGQYHQMKIYNVYEEQKSAGRPLVYQSYHVKYGNFLKEDATYDVFTIESCDHRVSNGSMPTYNMFTTTIAVVSHEDPTTPYFNFGGNAVNPQKTYVQNVLNAFNVGASLGNPVLAI